MMHTPTQVSPPNPTQQNKFTAGLLGGVWCALKDVLVVFLESSVKGPCAFFLGEITSLHNSGRF